ncbi:phosphatase 2C 6 [Spatholobus suberectus]|nr:phosphatase 2C 6 [Spatholobus suberectus]
MRHSEDGPIISHRISGEGVGSKRVQGCAKQRIEKRRDKEKKRVEGRSMEGTDACAINKTYIFLTRVALSSLLSTPFIVSSLLFLTLHSQLRHRCVMEGDEQLERFDSEFASTSSGSAISSTLSTEDFRNLTSSGDISSISSGSGEIPAVAVTEAVLGPPPPLHRAGSNGGQAPAAREKCVGRSNKGVSWGHTSVIGRRREMEDAVAVIPGFMSRTCDHVGGCTAPGSRPSGEIAPVHFFGVYDGHGGSQAQKGGVAF